MPGVIGPADPDEAAALIAAPHEVGSEDDDVRARRHRVGGGGYPGPDGSILSSAACGLAARG